MRLSKFAVQPRDSSHPVSIRTRRSVESNPKQVGEIVSIDKGTKIDCSFEQYSNAPSSTIAI
jgi:hypothetical protein